MLLEQFKAYAAPFLTADTFAIVYLFAGILFTLGLKGLAHPSTARRGNKFAMIGMTVAILMTLLHPSVHSYGLIFAGMAIGGVIGIVVALRIAMTAMPQLVAA